VDVYYESLCSDSMRWIVNQLVPSYPELKRHIYVTLVPYGKATVSNFIIASPFIIDDANALITKRQ